MSGITQPGVKGFVSRPAPLRFWEKVVKTQGCWLWMGNKSTNGYGQFYFDGRLVPAHRYAYELTGGTIPDGLEMDHLCRTRDCVNPGHLQPVTHRENTLRGDTLPARNAARTHCKSGHPLTGPNLVIRQGARHCRECEKLRHEREKEAVRG